MKIYVKSATTWRNVYDLADDLGWIINRDYNDDSVSVEQQVAAKSAADAIVWFMSTGRSYRDFEVSLKKAKLEKLIVFMIKDSKNANDYNTLIKSAERYLIRYCGMPRE